MPEINQYTVGPKELTELIVKSADLHEGRWWLAVTFGFAPGNFGPNDAELAPGVAVVVQNVFIQRALPGQPQPPDTLVVDAAAVNPKRPKAAKS